MSYAGAARILALALLWGSGFFWIKLSLRGLTPTQVLFARLALGALTLIVLLHSRGHRLPIRRQVWLHLAGASVFANVIPYLLFAIAEQEVDSALAGILNATTPLWTVAVAFVAGQTHRLNRYQFAGLMLGFAGTVLIFAPWNVGTQFASRGAVLCLLAAASYGFSYVYMARFLATEGSDPLVLSAGQLLAAAGLATFTLPTYSGLSTPEWRLDALVGIAILGIFGTGVAYVLNYRIITDDGAIAASVVTYLLPVVAVALGAIILQEEVTVHAVLGVLVVLVGVAATRLQRINPSVGRRPRR